jgi:hypothetical protein
MQTTTRAANDNSRRLTKRDALQRYTAAEVAEAEERHHFESALVADPERRDPLTWALETRLALAVRRMRDASRDCDAVGA